MIYGGDDNGRGVGGEVGDKDGRTECYSQSFVYSNVISSYELMMIDEQCVVPSCLFFSQLSFVYFVYLPQPSRPYKMTRPCLSAASSTDQNRLTTLAVYLYFKAIKKQKNNSQCHV